MGGGTRKFYTGTIVLQPPAALDAFVRAGAAGNEFVYCEAPEEQRSAEGWVHARELAQQGYIRTHQRRRQGGGWQWYAVRTAKCLPREQTAQQKVLADDAARIIFDELKRAANLALPCPSDTELARKAALGMRQQAQQRVRKLIDAGLIRSELAYEGGVPTRVVTIVASGKFTALPKKWSELRRAAERDAAAKQVAGGAK